MRRLNEYELSIYAQFDEVLYTSSSVQKHKQRKMWKKILLEEHMYQG